MFKTLAALAMLGVAMAEESNNQSEFVKNSEKLACLVYTDLAFYDIRKLAGGDQRAAYKHTSATSGVSYQWNFCDFEPMCGGETKTLASGTKGTTCATYSGSNILDIKSKAEAANEDAT